MPVPLHASCFAQAAEAEAAAQRLAEQVAETEAVQKNLLGQLAEAKGLEARLQVGVGNGSRVNRAQKGLRGTIAG